MTLVHEALAQLASATAAARQAADESMAASRARYVTLMLNPAAGDASELAELIGALGLSDDQVKADAAMLDKARQAMAERVNLDLADADRQREARLLDGMRFAFRILERERQFSAVKASERLDKARRACRELDVLARERPEFFATVDGLPVVRGYDPSAAARQDRVEALRSRIERLDATLSDVMRDAPIALRRAVPGASDDAIDIISDHLLSERVRLVAELAELGKDAD